MSDHSTSILESRTREPLLCIPEVADWLSISPHTLRYWRHVHRGPPSLSVGGAVRYRSSDVEDWLNRGAGQGHAALNEVAPAGNGRDATTSTDAAGPRDDAIVTA